MTNASQDQTKRGGLHALSPSSGADFAPGYPLRGVTSRQPPTGAPLEDDEAAVRRAEIFATGVPSYARKKLCSLLK